MTWPDHSARSVPLPPGWKALCQAVKARAGGQCEWVEDGQRCQSAGRDTDHIGNPDDHGPVNLRWLCAYHHAQRTALEAARVRAGQLAKLTMPRRRPPGMK